jgi:hypothetical protein
LLRVKNGAVSGFLGPQLSSGDAPRQIQLPDFINRWPPRVEAEAAALDAERKRRIRAAKAAEKKLPEAFAAYRRACAAVGEALDQVASIEQAIEHANELLGDGEQLAGAEQAYRGQPVDRREHIGRRVVGHVWRFEEDGNAVPERLVDKISVLGANVGELEVVDFRTAVHTLPELTNTDGDADYPKRKVRVRRHAIVETEYLEHRSALVVPPLASEVYLPQVVVPDTRPPRTTLTLRHVEAIEAAG